MTTAERRAAARSNVWFDVLEEPLSLHFAPGEPLTVILSGHRATYEIFREATPDYDSSRVAALITAGIERERGMGRLSPAAGQIGAGLAAKSNYADVATGESSFMNGLLLRFSTVSYRLVLTRNRHPIGYTAFRLVAVADSRKLFNSNAFSVEVDDVWIARAYAGRGFTCDFAEELAELVYRSLLELDARISAARKRGIKATMSVRCPVDGPLAAAFSLDVIDSLQRVFRRPADVGLDRLRRIAVTSIDRGGRC